MAVAGGECRLEKSAGDLDHSYLQYRMAKLLDRRGLLPLISVTTQVTPTRFRIPDVSAVRWMPSGRFLRKPPYVVVEILSPEDRADDLEDEVDDYLDFGRVCHDKVETSDGAISIPLSEIFADMPSIEEEE